MATPTRSTPRRPASVPQLAMTGTVVANQRLTTHLTRVTLHSHDLCRFDYVGPDQLVRLLLPPAPGTPVRLPQTHRWWPEICEMPEQQRPIVRNYTVRRIDRSANELDIDFVLHGDSGPASAWAGRARPGDQIGMLSDGAGYNPPADTTWQLLVADDTATPALAAILEQLDMPAVAIAEITDATEPPPLPKPATVDLSVLHRGTADHGAPTLDELRRRSLDPAGCYVWAAGESGLATSVRRHLVNQRGFAKGQIYFSGYWLRDH